MKTTTEMVREFHEAFGLPAPTTPGLPQLTALDRAELFHWAGALASLGRQLRAACAQAGDHGSLPLRGVLVRLQLGVEEYAEVAHAVAMNDLPAVLHELADVSYVADGSWVTFGLDDLQAAAMGLVHAANMAKLGPDGLPIVDAAGRVCKPPGWEPVDLGPLLVDVADILSVGKKDLAEGAAGG